MSTSELVVLAAAAIAATAADVVCAEAPSPDAKLAEGNAAFAVDLYQRLRAAEGNLFFSPHSISTALAMTYGGARGETAAQMQRTLRFALPPDELHAAFRAMEERLNGIGRQGRAELSVANALWMHQGYRFLPAFLELVERNYRAALNRADFAAAAEQARGEINRWVEQQTRGKITDLIPAGALNALTRLVLVNAVYFKGKWASPFRESQTQTDTFRPAPGRVASVQMMHQKHDFRYAEDAEVQVLEMVYEGGDLSMMVVLPRKVDGLGRLEEGLTAERIRAWQQAGRSREVDVFLPKFTATSQFGLGSTLAAMGMPDAFTGGQADFSGLDGSRELFISAVVHKAFVDVNEEGTEAAAATAVIIRMTSVELEAPVFRADHPFLFLIRDTKTGSVLFMGRLVNPPE